MKRNRSLILVIITLVLSACSSEHDKLLSAVKQYQVLGGSLDSVVAARAGNHIQDGKMPSHTWTQTKLDENTYQIQAQIGFVGVPTPQEIIEFKAVKDTEKSKLSGSHWKLEPQNGPAHEINRAP